MSGQGKVSRASWRRDIALYAAIAGLTAWQALKWEFNGPVLGNVILAALIGAKSKLSNGKPKEGQGE